MANITNDDMQDFDNFFAENPMFFDNVDLDNSGLTTDTDTESLNPANLAMANQLPMPMPNNFTAPEGLTPAMPMAPPTMMPPQPQMPNTAMGPCYHPMIGWYYPASQPAGVPPPPMIPVVGMTPVSSVPPTLPASAPQQPRAAPKRKYGPSAYLDARAAGRTSIGTDEANYFASSASRRDGRGEPAKSDSFDDSFRRAKTRPSIVQTCVCSAQPEHIPRPRNAFIIYRAAHQQAIRKKMKSDFNPDISKAAGNRWQNESKAVKDKFKALAEKEKVEHAKKYPDYKYRPGGPTRAKFGTKDCTCGAYELNVNRAVEKKDGRPRSQERLAKKLRGDDDDNDKGDDTYQPSTRARQQLPAPTAVMTAPPPNLDIASFGLPNNQAAEAAALYAGMKRKHDLTIATDREAEAPRKRRSPRSTAGQINYHEPDDDEMPFGELNNLDADDLFDFGASCKTPSSTAAEHFNVGISPKNLRSSRQSSLRQPISAPSPLFVAESPPPAPPARSTRSKSRGNLREPIEPSPFEEFLAGRKKVSFEEPPVQVDGEEEEAEGEEIAVNTSRKSTRAAGKASRSSSRSTTRSQSARTRKSPRRSGGR